MYIGAVTPEWLVAVYWITVFQIYNKVFGLTDEKTNQLANKSKICPIKNIKLYRLV